MFNFAMPQTTAAETSHRELGSTAADDDASTDHLVAGSGCACPGGPAAAAAAGRAANRHPACGGRGRRRRRVAQREARGAGPIHAEPVPGGQAVRSGRWRWGARHTTGMRINRK